MRNKKTHRAARQRLPSRFGQVLLGLVGVLMTACAHQSSTPGVGELPDLQAASGVIAVNAALAAVESPQPLVLTDEMRQFVDTYVRHGNQQQRLLTLHQSLRSPAIINIEYDPAADGTAAQVFNSGRANCLSYAHLFVAMARYAKLDADYLALTIRPEWSRHGDQIAIRNHVNVRVALRGGEEYMVDIDPISRDRVASAEVLSDEAAIALYHGNLAMEALRLHDWATAFGQALMALKLAPDLDYLWVNLGAIYRQAGQDEVAERLYLTALELNPESRPAMNNLAVLYERAGDLERSAYWADKITRHRDRNPYYHYHLGELAEQEGDLAGALQHYLDAIALKSSDAEFYYRAARVYRARNQPEQTVRYMEQAIERSRLVGERDEYQRYLREVTENDLARAAFADG